MSLYCGLSLQEVYARKCDDVGCKRNSLVYSMLSKTPDDFGLTFVDVSRNFVGPKGILALLEVIQCCRSLRNLDFRDQQLTKETVDAICVSLRAHPSVMRVNLSDNPINIAGGAAILELVRHNPNIEYVLLDNTHVRDTMIHTIEKQLAHNREAKRAVKGPNSWGNATDVAQDCQLESPRSQAVCGSGAAAVGLLRTSDAAATGIVAKAAPKEQRIPSLEVHALLSNFSSTVHDYLFDESPMDFMARQCADRCASFHDVQFPSDDKTVQREATQEFGIAGWKRLSELFPGATLFPRRDEDWGKCTGQNPFVLPERPRGGMTWLYAAVSASMSSRASLQSLILEPDEEIGNVGLFGVRFYIDGAWRFVLVDDFVPVNFCGEMIFTKPTQDGQYFWPCILEKVLAKLYGGYHELDQDVRRRRLIYEREEGLNADATMKKGPCCATVMGDFTGGVSIRRDLHHEAFDSNNWWMSMMGLMGEDPSSSMCVAMSRNEDKVLPGIDPYRPYQVLQARQVNGVRLLQIRFPWATNRWRGDWSEDSPSWSEYPDVDHAIRLKSSAQSRLAPNMKSKVISVATMNPKAKPLRMANFLCAKGMYGNASTGTTTEAFWISYLDFLKTFEEVHLCIHFAGYKERVIEGNWGVHTSGGPSSCHTWYTNPHFRLQVLQDGPFFINVSVPDTRFSTNPVDCIGFHILDDPLYPIRSPETTTGDGTPSERVVMDCKYVRSDSVSFEGIMKAGKVMWIIPSTYAAGMMGRFLLRIFSPASFVLSHEALERYWHKVDLMDTVMASGELQAGEDNSQVSITIAERDGLNGSSHAEETGDVGRIVVRAALENYELPESLQPFSTSLSDREGSAKRTCISSPLVASDDGNRPSMALYLVEAEMPRRDNIPSRTVGRLAGSDVLAESPFVVSERVFAETEIFSGDLMNVVCCIQPVGCTAAIKYTVWSTLPIQRCLACPQWQKECVDVRWDVGSGSYYEADHQPQVELTPVKANQRFVARLDLTEFTCIEPTIVLTVLANKDRVGEGLMGSILPERIVARSEYTRGTWVQCEFELTQDLDSVLVIPCLQPAGSMGAGRLCVSSEAEFFRVRTLTSVPTMEHAS